MALRAETDWISGNGKRGNALYGLWVNVVDLKVILKAIDLAQIVKDNTKGPHGILVRD